jgi:hypothetical protein
MACNRCGSSLGYKQNTHSDLCSECSKLNKEKESDYYFEGC